MFYLSLVLGSAFLVMMHHLFDASWSVGIRRFCEHLACLAFPWMAILFPPHRAAGAEDLPLDELGSRP